MVICSIRLINFQLHIDSTFDLVDGINALVGPSDGGKSAVLKALKWLSKNEPTGAEMIRDGQKECIVILVVSGGDSMWTITKKRTKTKTVYILETEYYDDPEPHSQVFEACGRDVPDEIQQVLNFGDYNIQSQFDGFFLLDKKPGDIAKALHEHAGISDIDTYTTTINSKIKSIKSETTKIDANIEIITNLIAESPSQDDLDQMQALIDKIIMVQGRIVDYKENLVSLIETENDYEQLIIKEENLPCYDGINDIIEEIIKKINNSDKLSKSLKVIDKLDKKLKSLNDKILIYPKLSEIDELIDLISRRDTHIFKLTCLDLIEQEALKLDKIETRCLTKSDKLHVSLEKITDGLDTCPFCGGGLHADCNA